MNYVSKSYFKYFYFIYKNVIQSNFSAVYKALKIHIKKQSCTSNLDKTP